MYKNFLLFMSFTIVQNMLVNLFFSSFLDEEHPELPDIDIPSLLRPRRNFNRNKSGSDTETVIGKDVTDIYQPNF